MAAAARRRAALWSVLGTDLANLILAKPLHCPQGRAIPASLPILTLLERPRDSIRQGFHLPTRKKIDLMEGSSLRFDRRSHQHSARLFNFCCHRERTLDGTARSPAPSPDAWRFLILIQCFDLPPRYGRSRCLETKLSNPIWQAARDRSGPTSIKRASLLQIGRNGFRSALLQRGRFRRHSIMQF